MRFYGTTYQETLGLPIRTFWMLSRNVDRLEAGEDLRRMRIAVASQSGETFEKFNKDLVAQIGEIVVRSKEEADEPVYDRNALLALKGKGRLV